MGPKEKELMIDAESLRSCPVPIEELERSVGDWSEAVTLPSECYTSPEFYEFETEVIFSHEWLGLGRADQIPNPGDYFTITIVDEPLIVVRDQEGEIVVMSAVCQHRGTVLVDGSGNCGRHFRCPYHWWTYDLQGNLTGAPEMSSRKGFDKRDIHLHRLEVEIWNGFIFANFDQEAPPLAPRLKRIEPLLENYHLEKFLTTVPDVMPDLPFNWKIMMENGTEPYHAPFLHHRFVPRPPPGARGNFIECEDGDNAMASVVELGYPDGGINRTYKLFMPPIETLTIEERSRWVFATIPPNTMIFWEADMVSYFLLLPNGPDKTTMLWAYCVPESTMKNSAFSEWIEMVKLGIDHFNRDDFTINASIQRGFKSRFANRGSYAHQEECLVHINRWLVERYKRQEERVARAPQLDVHRAEASL
jgi:phenylpropionate dioxygenase-like ring-hydroxylating dioxygenase large terminal subunit